MKSSRIILSVIIVVFVFTTCEDNPSSYVGDSDPTKEAVINGIVVDSTSREPLQNVTITITSVFADSSFIDSVITDAKGQFDIRPLYNGEYYLSLKSTGYLCKDIVVRVQDTLSINKPIALRRFEYPFKEVAISEMPTDPNSEGYFFMLNPDVFGNINWHVEFDAPESFRELIYSRIDSVIISLLRNDIQPDTIWYKYWQADCGALLISSDPKFVIKIDEDKPMMKEYNFVNYDFTLISPSYCIDSSETILRYSFFGQ